MRDEAVDQLTGGLDFNDHRLIWDRLAKFLANPSDMVLLHSGSPKGAELIAAKWADKRKVPRIAFEPDWAKHAKPAPFKRNDAPPWRKFSSHMKGQYRAPPRSTTTTNVRLCESPRVYSFAVPARGPSSKLNR